MNKFHFNAHKPDTWKCDWLIGHIISISINYETSKAQLVVVFLLFFHLTFMQLTHVPISLWFSESRIPSYTRQSILLHENYVHVSCPIMKLVCRISLFNFFFTPLALVCKISFQKITTSSIYRIISLNKDHMKTILDSSKRLNLLVLKRKP